MALALAVPSPLPCPRSCRCPCRCRCPPFWLSFRSEAEESAVSSHPHQAPVIEATNPGAPSSRRFWPQGGVSRNARPSSPAQPKIHPTLPLSLPALLLSFRSEAKEEPFAQSANPEGAGAANNPSSATRSSLNHAVILNEVKDPCIASTPVLGTRVHRL